MQAKSRLSSSQIKKLADEKRQPHQSKKSSAKQAKHFSLENYIRLLPTLGLGIITSAGLTVLLTRAYPASIADWPLYHSYLPLLILFFLSCFFIASFLMQQARQGLLMAVFLTLLLFLKLQDVVINPLVAVVLGGSLLLIEGVFKLVFKR